jgi:hypothetical protein
MTNINYKMLNRVLSFIAVSILFGACQTPPIKDFEHISLGQDKSDVIETVGGPSWSDRRKGIDRWTYIIYQDGVRLERQVHFLDGIVTYKGEPVQPFITAEEQDQFNAEKNLALDSMEHGANSSSTKIRSSRKAKSSDDSGNSQ